MIVRVEKRKNDLKYVIISIEVSSFTLSPRVENSSIKETEQSIEATR